MIREAEMHLIRFDLPFGEAKNLWNILNESAYIAQIIQETNGNLSFAARKNKIDRKHLRALIHRYKINVHDPIPETQTVSVDVELPFENAKTRWIEFFERAYLMNAYAKTTVNALIGRNICLDRKHVRNLLRKYKIRNVSRPEQPKPTQETDVQTTQELTKENLAYAKLKRQFYNGICFKRGMIAYLHFNGKRTTLEGMHHIVNILGGQNVYRGKLMSGYWNPLQVILAKLNILIPVTNYAIYDWNDALVPIEYKDALERKLAGESVKEILAFYFPDEPN
ncbi:MAG: hypothetical protein NTX72_00050 [Candidatus Uhrbacteria bacterium]|nr:hypothetical protein [Candidatus Uhrbacteria bacterium]